jgi:hypothetical protein
MSFSSSQYDPENRFMRCAMEHKIEKRISDISLNRIDISPKVIDISLKANAELPLAIDIDNRFQRCAIENKLTPYISPSSPSSRYLERERDFISNHDSIPVRGSRSNSGSSSISGSSTNKYPNSRLRSKLDVTPKLDTIPKTHSDQDVRLLDSPNFSPKQKKDSFEDHFPSLSPSLSPIKTPVMPPLRSPQSEKSPKKNVIDSITSISLQGGKLITKEIITIVEEPPPLVITPSKWSDLLRSSAK